MLFNVWIRQQVKRKDAVGVLARIIQDDHCWPEWARTLKTCLHHLRFHGAVVERLNVLRLAWREYEAALRK